MEVLFISFCACVRNTLKTATFVIRKIKLVSFSLFLDVSPPKPKISFGQGYVAINTYNMCKGRLGSRGERGCTSRRIHHTSDKKRSLCKMVFLLYINCLRGYTFHKLLLAWNFFLYKQKCFFYQADGYLWPDNVWTIYTSHIDHFTPQHTAFEQYTACLSVFLDLLAGLIPLAIGAL